MSSAISAVACAESAKRMTFISRRLLYAFWSSVFPLFGSSPYFGEDVLEAAVVRPAAEIGLDREDPDSVRHALGLVVDTDDRPVVRREDLERPFAVAAASLVVELVDQVRD